jgi:hypothetical protein
MNAVSIGNPAKFNEAKVCEEIRESCIAGAAGQEWFAYGSTETWAPVPCKDGCTLRIPAIAQRVLFYRVKYFDADGKPSGETGASAVAVP